VLFSAVGGAEFEVTLYCVCHGHIEDYLMMMMMNSVNLTSTVIYSARDVHVETPLLRVHRSAIRAARRPTAWASPCSDRHRHSPYRPAPGRLMALHPQRCTGAPAWTTQVAAAGCHRPPPVRRTLPTTGQPLPPPVRLMLGTSHIITLPPTHTQTQTILQHQQ